MLTERRFRRHPLLIGFLHTDIKLGRPCMARTSRFGSQLFSAPSMIAKYLKSGQLLMLSLRSLSPSPVLCDSCKL
ncbi:unnamed protein product [Coffea canephora]|uniref:Uncharacterized protein n=1 Tax=Coffea canephora TaxID=49390 RepID=A0A068U4A8_COFCA|nr:unnamed protein product [Coffea canephora]